MRKPPRLESTEPESSEWLNVLVLAIAWGAALFFLVRPDPQMREETDEFVFERVAEGSIMQLLVADEYPERVLEWAEVDKEHLREDLVEVYKESLLREVFPETSFPSWALLFHLLGEEKLSEDALNRVSEGSLVEERQAQVVEAIRSGAEADDALTEWTWERYTSPNGGVPEWFWIAFRENYEESADWLEGKGRNMLNRGLAATFLYSFIGLLSLLALIWFLLRRTAVPRPGREFRLIRRWRSAVVLKEFFLAELLGVVAAMVIANIFYSIGWIEAGLLAAGVSVMVLPVAWLVVRLTPGIRPSLRLVGLRAHSWPRRKLIAFGFAGLSLMMGGAFLIDRITSPVDLLRDGIDPYELDSNFYVGWGFLYAVVFAAICEEIVFRGFLFRGLRNRFPAVVAACLSSGIFAVVHFYSVIGLLVVFAYGLIFCWLYERSRSLLPGMIAHAVFNFCATSHVVGWFSLH